MLMELVRYTNRAFDVPTSKKRRKTAAPIARIKAAEAALHSKLRVLRAAPEIHQRLQTARLSVVGHRILERARHYPPACHLWQLIEWLAQRLVAIIEITFSIDPDLTVLHDAPAQELATHVAALYQATMTTPPPPDERAGIISGLIAQVEHKYKEWLRALITKFDFHHYQSATDALAHTTRPHVVCFDISRSSKTLRQEVQKGRPDLQPRLDKWRSRLAAVPWNWSILCNGLVVREHGDSEIILFEDPLQAFTALVLTAAHVSVFNKREHDPEFPYLMKGGIGTAPVFSLAEQYESTAMNDSYAAIRELVDQKKVVPANDPVILALDGFLKTHGQLEAYSKERHQFSGGTAVLLDWQAALQAILSRLE